VSVQNFLSTFVRIFEGVKRPTQGAKPPSFEGIGAVVLFAFLVVSATLLAIPRAAEPERLPLPQPDRRVLARAWAREAELARKARDEPLPFAVRAVGETVRRLGAGTVDGEGVPSGLLRDLETLSRDALLQKGADALLGLRAVQTELFVQAARAWESTGRVSTELRELGGDFPETAKARGWFRNGRLDLDDEELAILFRMRWLELTKAGQKPPLAASLDEYRAFYALLLSRAGATSTTEQDRTSLLAVAALERLDPTYPADLARGVLLYRRSAHAAAAEAFQRELQRRKDGPYRLLARNHLLAALAKLPEEE
jgi:hypothetical protein